MLLDLQMATVYRDLKNVLPHFKGKVLDIGCGQSPFKFLLSPSTAQYIGIDIVDAEKFDYRNPDITQFDGENIPFEDGYFDALICTEVLEHVEKYQKLIEEMYRVTKKGGSGIVTIPWSARYHYIPYDFFRYTPSSLKTMFSQFGEVQITARGTDAVSIVSKMIVLWCRNIFPAKLSQLLWIPVWVLTLPVLGLSILAAHLCILFSLGSEDDPLGYTVRFTK